MNKYAKRYLIDALSGMAQGLFASLLVGTIVKTLGQQLLKLGENAFFNYLVTAGTFASDAKVFGAAMAVGIGFALKAPALVLFSLIAVGAAANVTGAAGGPLAVLIIAIVASEQKDKGRYSCNSSCYNPFWSFAYCVDGKIHRYGGEFAW